MKHQAPVAVRFLLTASLVCTALSSAGRQGAEPGADGAGVESSAHRRPAQWLLEPFHRQLVNYDVSKLASLRPSAVGDYRRPVHVVGDVENFPVSPASSPSLEAAASDWLAGGDDNDEPSARLHPDADKSGPPPDPILVTRRKPHSAPSADVYYVSRGRRRSANARPVDRQMASSFGKEPQDGDTVARLTGGRDVDEPSRESAESGMGRTFWLMRSLQGRPSDLTYDNRDRHGPLTKPKRQPPPGFHAIRGKRRRFPGNDPI